MSPAAAVRAVAPRLTTRPIPTPPDPIPDRLVPILTDGGTVVCLASGPSLTAADVETVRGRAVVVAVNDAIRLAPWADVFYSGARVYWTPKDPRGRLLEGFAGLRVRLCLDQDRPGVGADGVIRLRHGGADGLARTPNALTTYQNSGGAAINLAVHLGARRIVLLGYDMGPADGRHHFHDAPGTRHSSPYALFTRLLATSVAPLAAAGVEVVNCSRRTALACFPRVPLEAIVW